MEKIINTSYERYSFDILSKESVFLFLKTLGYKFVEYNEEKYDSRDMETNVTILICAVKGKEKPNPYYNEITVVFRKEFENSILSLLVNAREIVYNANQKVNPE